MKKRFIFFIIVLLSLSNFVVAQYSDKSPHNGAEEVLPFQNIDALWDVQFDYNAETVTGALGNAAAYYIQSLGEFWTSRWASALLHRWSSTGTLLEEFSITNVTGVRSITSDGTFLYAGNNTTTIQVIDPVTKTRVGTITAPQTVRYITYDPTADGGAGGFWLGNFSTNLQLISMTGTVLVTHPYASLGVTSIYGGAWDGYSVGGPFLWLWGQGAGAGSPQWIVQINPATGLPTGVTHDVLTDVGLGNASAIAGGLFVTEGLEPGFSTIGGLLQGTPDRLFGYELTSLVGPGGASNPAPPNGSGGVPINALVLSWTNPAGATTNEVWFGTDPGSLNSIHSGSLVSSVNAPSPLAYNTQYYWRVDETDGSGTTIGSVWTFTTVQAGPGAATNPDPPDNSSNVAAIDLMLSWTNPGGTISNEVWFGTDPGNLTSIHSGSLVSSLNAPSPLDYNTQYYWRVDETDATGTTISPIWTFKTEFPPGVNILSANPGPANNGGSAGWAMFFDLIADPDYTVEVFQMTTASNAAVGANFTLEFFIRSGTGLGGPVGSGPGSSSSGWTSLGSVPVTQGNEVNGISLPFATPTITVPPGETVGVAMLFTGAGPRYFGTGTPPLGTYTNSSLTLITGDVRSVPFTTGGSWFSSRELVGDIYFAETIIPVELTSFTASAIDNKVTLNWSTASETNNSGFQVERNSGSGFVTIGFVEGFGTTTEAKSYTFTDGNLSAGSYSYRLKQVDYDGTFEYSNEIEVDVLAPKEFALNQNFPNPFNPATKITFSLAIDSKVSLKIFDVLGQEVMTLVNQNLAAGQHEVNFDAVGFNSGVYFYRIEASGTDGQTFASVKKMILTK